MTLTYPDRPERAVTDPVSSALQALGWIVSDPGRVARLLDLTGLGPPELRARASDPAMLAAAIGFLEAYEPDLIACAEAIGTTPDALVTARAELER